MKKIIYFLIIISLPLQAQRKESPVKMPVYPSFVDAAGHFFSKYSFPETKDNKRYTFAKKPDGWHILLVDEYNSKVVEDYLLWDRNNSKYLELYFPKATSSQAKIPDEYNNWSNRYFNRISPYFGYEGWDSDVISAYGELSNFSDTVLNALARAYSSYAVNLLSNRGYSDSNKKFRLKDGLNALSAEQLKIYRCYQHKGIECYRKLCQINPRFETFVGDIFTVYSNEVMNSFLTIRQYQNEEEAHKELKPDLYDSFYISLAKNYLASCDSNAILFTNGDSDTYPLLYVQEYYRFRPDVLVVNVSLLQSSHYINHFFNRFSPSDPIKTTIDQEKYRNGSVPYAYIINRVGEEYIELKDILEFVNSSDTATKFKYGDHYYTYVPTTKYRLTIDKQKMLKSGIISGDYAGKMDSVINWDIEKKDAIYQSDLAMLDILATEWHERPVYIAGTVADEYFLNLFNYLQHEGYAYKIVPVKYEYKDFLYGRIKTDELYDKILNKYIYSSLKNDSVNLSTAHKQMISNIGVQFSRLASRLIEENKLDSTRRVLAFFEEKFPYELIAHNYYSILLAEAYYKIDDIDKSNKLIRFILKFYVDKLEGLKGIAINPDNEKEIKMSLYIFDELIRLCTTYEQKGLIPEIESAKKKYGKMISIPDDIR